MKHCVGWVTSVATTEAISSGCNFFFGSLPDAAPLPEWSLKSVLMEPAMHAVLACCTVAS